MKRKKTVELSIQGKKYKSSIPGLEFRLDLVELDADENRLILKGTDNRGFVWCILAINCDGTFRRMACLPHNMGLQVDKVGRILEEKQYE